ncbi:MAG: GDSL-type esterase/lipase family protein [Treponema sp.]|nr:GDSL-type esterase/lipase family protein [Treponema sp.]
MKKSIIFIAVILGLAIGFSFTGCDNGVINSSQDTTLVCLGNSLTAGYGATAPWTDDKSNSYPAYLQDKINIPVVNAGVSGNTTSQGLSRINRDVLSKNPRIVIIELGANDLFQRIPITDIRDNLQNIINKLNNGNRKIYLAKFYTDKIARTMANGIGITNYILQTAFITRYNNMFNTLSSSNNVVLIEDIWDGVWGIHMSDSIHPNAAGYKIMANNYFKILQPYLQANGLLK